MLALLNKWRRKLSGADRLDYRLRIPFGNYGGRLCWSNFMEVTVYRDGSYSIRRPAVLNNQNTIDRYRVITVLVHALGRRRQLETLTEYVTGTMALCKRSEST